MMSCPLKKWSPGKNWSGHSTAMMNAATNAGFASVPTAALTRGLAARMVALDMGMGPSAIALIRASRPRRIAEIECLCKQI